MVQVAEANEDETPVDVVYTWVDGADRSFRRALDHHTREGSEASGDPHASGAMRYRDHGELRYSLRSVHKFAPWVRKIFVVTNGQVPRWLNTDHPRVTVVPHEAIYSDRSHLPTFNSCSIECHLHRISGLAEHFIYLNDDFLLGRPLALRDLYHPQRGHRIRLEPWGISSRPGDRPVHDHIIAQTQRLLDERFGARAVRKNLAHTPLFVVKEDFRRLTALWPESFRTTSSHRFRSAGGIAPFYLYYNYVIESGLPCVCTVPNDASSERPSDEYHYGHLTRADLERVLQLRPLFFVLNDTIEGLDFDLDPFLSQLYPDPSPFESDQGSAGLRAEE